MASPKTTLGPLTTTFKAPDDCYDLFIQTHAETTDGYFANLQYSCDARGDGQTLILDPAETCLPESLSSYYNRPSLQYLDTIAVYSPGSVCPSGWSTACSIHRRGGDSPPSTSGLTTAKWEMWNLAEENQVVVGCCPSGYECDDDGSVLSCVSNGKVGEEETGFDFTDDCEKTSVTVTIGETQSPPFATAIRILMIQDTDDDDAAGGESTHTIEETSSTSQGPGGGSGSDSGNGSSSGGGGGSGGLSTGAKAAIGVVIPLVFIAAALAVFWFIIRSRRRERNASGSPQGVNSEIQGQGMKAELAGSHGAAFQGPSHLAHEKPELDSQHPPGPPAWHQSLGAGANQRRHELRGSDTAVRQELAPGTEAKQVHELETVAAAYPELDSERSVRPAELQGDQAMNSGGRANAPLGTGGQQSGVSGTRNEPWRWNEEPDFGSQDVPSHQVSQ